MKGNANVNERNDDGSTALHRASANGYYATCQLLISYKANVNQKTNYGWTALFNAALKGTSEEIRVRNS